MKTEEAKDRPEARAEEGMGLGRE